MSRLMRLLARLYPASWRSRYEAEFDALLEDVKPGWGALFDILQGAAVTQVRTGSVVKIAIFTAVMGLAGLLIGLAVSVGMPEAICLALGHSDNPRPVTFRQSFVQRHEPKSADSVGSFRPCRDR